MAINVPGELSPVIAARSLLSAFGALKLVRNDILLEINYVLTRGIYSTLSVDLALINRQ